MGQAPKLLSKLAALILNLTIEKRSTKAKKNGAYHVLIVAKIVKAYPFN